MQYPLRKIERLENKSVAAEVFWDQLKLMPGAYIIQSSFSGPATLGRHGRVGPETEAGRYFVLSDDSAVIRASIGNYCTFGMRVSVNPFSHPTDWLSVHEFQYHAFTFDFIQEYARNARLPREAAVAKRVDIGSDVWIGNNAVVLGGVVVGHGAIIAAGSIVTKDVPAYAIVAGNPARLIKYRYSEEIIERQLRLKWWELELDQLSGLPFNEIGKCLEAIEGLRAT